MEWAGMGGVQNHSLDSEERIPTCGALTVSRERAWSRSLKEDLHLQKGLFISIFAAHGAGWGARGGGGVPVSSFIVASEDIAILSKQKSPTTNSCVYSRSALRILFGRGRRDRKGLICLN